MSQLATHLGTIVLLVAGAAPESNPTYENLRQRGVPIPSGAAVKLPPPILTDGMTAAAQTAAIAKLAEPNYSLEEFTRESRMAPYALDMRAIPIAGARAAQAIDIAFVAYGDWHTVQSETFLSTLFKGNTPSAREGQVSRSAVLTRTELEKRDICVPNKPGREHVYFTGTGRLFDRVQLSTAWHGVLTRTADSALLAAQIDPRFVNDPEYPDQWRSISIDDAGNEQLGAPRPYVNAGFYGKVTRLAQPAGAMLFEYHIMFDEPEGWFGGANLLRSKLPLVLQDQIRSFRKKLADASQGK